MITSNGPSKTQLKRALPHRRHSHHYNLRLSFTSGNAQLKMKLINVLFLLLCASLSARIVFGINIDFEESDNSDAGTIRNGIFTDLVVDDGACISNPCLNDGLCMSSRRGFVCICMDGHLGVYCERKADECPIEVANVERCLNNGLCKLNGNGTPICHCDTGYHGDHCQFEIEYCHDNPCLNDGLCHAKDHGYKCQCTAGFTGKNCQFTTQAMQTCLRMDPSVDQGNSLHWRENPVTVTVRWGYDSNLTCNSFDTCFGLSTTDDNNSSRGYVDVQLFPIQVQSHDALVFITNDKSDPQLGQFQPYLLDHSYLPQQAFHECDFTNAKLLESSIEGVNQTGSEYHINVSSLLTLGNNYFAADINIFLQCKFGLRLNVTVKEASCFNPLMSSASDLCHGVGKCETSYSDTSYRCNCCQGYSGEFCELEDPCYVNPCFNGGRCIGDERNGIYTCHCPIGYEGRRCGDVVNHCSENPCYNGGSCSSILSGYVCQCITGYTGSRCESVIDKCSNAPCHNGATCYKEGDSFRCQCQQGYHGSLCEIDVDECASNPCVNGACQDGENIYRCNCNAGYTGQRCESKLNLCHSNPCVNGQCISTQHGFECSCGRAYIGRLCEIKLDLCSLKEFCVREHASDCIDNGMDASCICKHGYEGVNCAVNTDDCAGASCPGSSYCIDRIGEFECICKDGEKKDNCDALPDATTNAIQSPTHSDSRLQYDVFQLDFNSNDCYRLQQQSSLRGLRSAISSCVRQSCKCSYSEDNVVFDLGSVGCFDSSSGRITAQLIRNNHVTPSRLKCQLQACLDASTAAQLGYGSLQTKPIRDCQPTIYSSSTVNLPPITKLSGGLGLDVLIAILTTLAASIVLSVGLFVFCWKRRLATRVASRQERSFPAPKRKRMVAFSGEFDKVHVKRPCRTTKVKRLSINPVKQQHVTKVNESLARCTGSEAH